MNKEVQIKETMEKARGIAMRIMAQKGGGNANAREVSASILAVKIYDELKELKKE